MAKPQRRKVRIHIGRKTQPASSKKLPWSGILLVVVLILAAVGVQQFLSQNQNNEIPIQDYNNSYRPPEGSPGLLIISPQSGEAFKSSTVSVRLNVTNFQLVDIVANRQNVENQGHLLFFIDGKEQRSVYTVTSVANLEKGSHTLTIYLENNDKTHRSPLVYATVKFMTE